MTPRRAGTLIPATKPGLARVHFAYLDNERIGQYDLYTRNADDRRHMEGARAEHQQNAVAGTPAPQTALCQRSNGTGASGHGCNGTAITTPCAALLSIDRQSNELKLLPAPQVAGLLPARVPIMVSGKLYKRSPAYAFLTPQRQAQYDQYMACGFGFRWELQEIEAAYAATKPHVVTLFKRFFCTRYFDDDGHEIVRG
jgi:hypothetical protein